MTDSAPTACFFQNKGIFLLKIMLIYDERRLSSQPLRPKVLEIQLYYSCRQFHMELLFLAGHLTVSCSVELFAGQR